MAVAIKVKVPGQGAEFYDSVMRELDWEHTDYPDGLISHYAGPVEGGWFVLDIWQSEEDFNQFAQQDLIPALQKVAGGDAPPIQPTVIPIHNQVHAASRVGA